jgi:sugar phosphate isomerase/epimerase
MAKRAGLNYMSLKDMHLPLTASAEDIQAATAKIRDAKITLYGGGVIYMKTAEDVSRAFDYAKTAGMKTIIGVPNHELLELVNQKAVEYDIEVAIHNHGPGDKLYPTPESVYEKVKGLDRRLGLCMDIGHTERCGLKPDVDIQRFADRLLDVHLKDVSASTAEGTTVEMGRGVIDIPAVIRALLKFGYNRIASFEYEKDDKDPLPGLAESIGYTRGSWRRYNSLQQETLFWKGMSMKNIIALIVCVSLAIVLAACTESMEKTASQSTYPVTLMTIDPATSTLRWSRRPCTRRSIPRRMSMPPKEPMSRTIWLASSSTTTAPKPPQPGRKRFIPVPIS